MFFRRCYDDQLAQASYLIGCQVTGAAIVVDPSRVIAPYLEAAAAEGLKITAVAETHIHADFVSGARELAAATGALIHLSGCGPPEWQYGYRSDSGVAGLEDGSVITLGKVRLQAVHTPGHTPEHLSFLVTDTAAADEPMGILSGDFVFVGDVGRPDLLEKAARMADTATAAARQLYQSLAWFKSLPDHLQVWPGHGAGSACGKGLGAVPQSTVGYERRFNWALGTTSEAEFVAAVLAGQPDPPRYFGRMKRINRDGPRVMGRLPEPPRLTTTEVEQALAAGATVVDARPAAAFAAGHIPGSINVPFSRNFATYAGSVIEPEKPVQLIAPDGSAATGVKLVHALVSIGLEQIGGIAGADVVAAWATAGGRLDTVAQVTVAELGGRPKDGVVIVDVRNRSEWDEGHVPGARLVPLPELIDRLHEIPKGADVVLHCQGGGRAAIAASVLKAAGIERVSSLIGGFGAWEAAGEKILRD